MSRLEFLENWSQMDVDSITEGAMLYAQCTKKSDSKDAESERGEQRKAGV